MTINSGPIGEADALTGLVTAPPGAMEREDERDEADRLKDPRPKPIPSPFARMEGPPAGATELAAGQVAVTVINRVIRNEGVGSCAITIGSVSGAANAHGDARLDISALADGEYDIAVMAPDIHDGEVGPGFPANTTKERIWRPLKGRVTIAGGQVTRAEPAEAFKISGSHLEAGLTPVWLRGTAYVRPRPHPPDMIVIHHTAGFLAGDFQTLLYDGAVSVHYLIGPNGDVYKMVDESQSAAQAGDSFWQGVEQLNAASIGIEISHRPGLEFPAVQLDAAIDLVRRLKAAFPSIPPGRVIAHSDIAIDHGDLPLRHGRRSGDPSSAFPWERIEAMGLSFQPAPGTLKPGMYGGFFAAVPDGKLAPGDRDDQHRYGGQVRPAISGAVGELQNDLKRLGYLCPPDGAYGDVTKMALLMFQQHMFSGSRRAPPGAFNCGDGKLDATSAEMLKRALGEVEPLVS